VASDASFADHSIDRKSSQAYAMKMFGGVIGWRASKQETVTTSTTEAEFLALSQAAKEALFVSSYTMGMQRPIELSPERWVCIQQVLDLVKMYLAQTSFPSQMDVNERWPGVLRPDAQQLILGRIAKHICETGLNGFPIARQPEPVREAVFRYITEPNLTADEIAQVENQGPGGF
jgi:hypothetical protein